MMLRAFLERLRQERESSSSSARSSSSSPVGGSTRGILLLVMMGVCHRIRATTIFSAFWLTLLSSFPQQRVRWIHSSSSSSSSSSLQGQHESYLGNSRFWTKTINIDVDPDSSTSGLLDKIKETLLSSTAELKLPSAQMGVAIYPFKNLLVPIHEGMVQPQHAVLMERPFHFQGIDIDSTVASAASTADNSNSISNKSGDSSGSLIVCGFSPRANHIMVAPSEEERPIDAARLEALDLALLQCSDPVSGAQLLSDEFAGTSPSRIYRSFVSPRPKAIHILEPVERAAKRTAQQIQLALRQVRADQAAYLRNNDRSVHLQDEQKGVIKNPMVVVLDNVRSAFNVGSLFRTSETAGVSELITVGITPHPPHPKLRKTAFSSLDVVPHRHFEDIADCIAALRSEGYTIVVMETTSLSQEYTQVAFPEKVAVVLGNEVTGVDSRVIEMADIVTEIPCFGVKNSLNVASAAPIVMFEILRQWKSNRK